MGESIRGGITGDGQHNIFKWWKDLDIHGISHKRSLVCKIHEGVKVKDGSCKEAMICNHM